MQDCLNIAFGQPAISFFYNMALCYHLRIEAFTHSHIKIFNIMYKKCLLLIALTCAVFSGKSQHFFNGEKENVVHSSEENTPTSIHMIDLDGDGDPDMLSSTGEDNRIAWYKNVDGQGNYGAQQTISASSSKAQAVYSADLNGDGNPDVLAASEGDSTIAWYENTDGQGTFGPKQIITQSASGAQSVSASDIDGDGDQDVVVTYRRHIKWYENVDGQGSFGTKQALSLKPLGDSLKTWRRNTYPGPLHKSSPDFPPYQGSDRSEWMHFFKVSPADPTFMLNGFDMGPAYISTDGREFESLDLPLHRFALNVSFSPHDGNTAYLLYGTACGTVGYCYTTESVIPGIWRTEDKGETWEQIYQMPDNTPQCKGPAGKNQIAEDPHPGRSDHIYFGSNHRGLVRSVDDGASWEVVAFEGHPIKTLDAAKGPEDQTVLYVIVGEPDEYGSRNIIPDGKFWRVEVDPQPPYEVSTVQLSTEGDFVDVAVSPDDWSRGMIIRDYEDNSRGGEQLAQFSNGGTVLDHKRTSSEANVKHFVDVHINPQNPDHVVVRSQASGLSVALQYSLDGGKTWNDPYTVVDGHIPSMLSYNPAHHTATDGAMRNAWQQAQGTSVGFDANNPKVVYWWTQNFDKTPLKSRDYGATWKPFAYGGPYKEASQIAVGPEAKNMGVSRAEYGFVTTRDSGLSWRASTHVTDPLLSGGSTAGKYGRGIGYHPDNSDTVIALYGVPSQASILMSKDGGLSWENTGAKTSDEGCVYWSRANTSVVYVGDQRSRDAGDTWQAINRFVLDVSPSNENVLVGNQSTGAAQLSLSIDGGDSWTDLPAIPKENFPGTTTEKSPFNPVLTTGIQPTHAVAIDPDSEHDPALGGSEGVRILAAGRMGVYEYTAEPGDPYNGSWNALNEGFLPSVHFSYVEEVYWVGHVLFDPRPGMENVVYACKLYDPEMVRPWRSRNNSNMIHTNGQAKYPLYRSTDGGQTWNKLHEPEYTGIPNHLDVTAIEVGADGKLYVGGFCGLYILPGIPE